MGAAAWTQTAEDITSHRDRWNEYLDINQLADRVNLAVSTIQDVLTRRPREEDPRHAIYRPAARIGRSALNAAPMWLPAQAVRYDQLADDRATASRINVAKLPVISVSDAAERGLATIEELAGITGRAENTLRRWRRDSGAFPPPVGKADRVPPFQYGPPRILYSVAAVQAFSASARETPAADPSGPAAQETPSGDRDDVPA